MPAKLNLIYITARDKDEARRIGRALVEGRFAACVNIIDGMNSMYWWKSEVQDDTEAVLIAKTRESLVPDLVAKVKELHSYQCPCIVAIPIVDGNADFLRWVETETRT